MKLSWSFIILKSDNYSIIFHVKKSNFWIIAQDTFPPEWTSSGAVFYLRTVRKILQHKRHFKAIHWDLSKLTHFNSVFWGGLRAILVKIPVEMCQFTGIRMAEFFLSAGSCRKFLQRLGVHNRLRGILWLNLLSASRRFNQEPAWNAVYIMTVWYRGVWGGNWVPIFSERRKTLGCAITKISVYSMQDVGERLH